MGQCSIVRRAVFFFALAAVVGGCRVPTTPPRRPIEVPPASAFPCGEFNDIALSCYNEETPAGTTDHFYLMNLQVFCDDAGTPLVVVTSASANMSEDMFMLGANCGVDTDIWAFNDDLTAASTDCTDHWGDGSTTRYQFALRFTSNVAPLHGTINFNSQYDDSSATVYTPGFMNCTF